MSTFPLPPRVDKPVVLSLLGVDEKVPRYMDGNKQHCVSAQTPQPELGRQRSTGHLHLQMQSVLRVKRALRHIQCMRSPYPLVHVHIQPPSTPPACRKALHCAPAQQQPCPLHSTSSPSPHYPHSPSHQPYCMMPRIAPLSYGHALSHLQAQPQSTLLLSSAPIGPCSHACPLFPGKAAEQQ